MDVVLILLPYVYTRYSSAIIPIHICRPLRRELIVARWCAPLRVRRPLRLTKSSAVIIVPIHRYIFVGRCVVTYSSVVKPSHFRRPLRCHVAFSCYAVLYSSVVRRYSSAASVRRNAFVGRFYTPLQTNRAFLFSRHIMTGWYAARQPLSLRHI